MCLLMLQEMKLSRFLLQMARRLWEGNFFGFLHKNVNGRSEGILVAWNKDLINISELHMGSFSNSLKYFSSACSFDWMFSSVYRLVINADRNAMWEELSVIHYDWKLPWCVAGDFNIIRYPFEKWGGCRLSRKMKLFS